MKVKFIDVLLILFGLFLAYQILRKILWGSWETEAIIIALLFFNIGLTWKLSTSFIGMNMKLEGHINWHKFRDNNIR